MIVVGGRVAATRAWPYRLQKTLFANSVKLTPDLKHTRTSKEQKTLGKSRCQNVFDSCWHLRASHLEQAFNPNYLLACQSKTKPF